MRKSLVFILSLLLLSFSFDVEAHDFSALNSDGDTIYYNIKSTTLPYTLEVTFKGDNSMAYLNEYIGAVQIPSTVIYSSVLYNVTSIGDNAFAFCPSLTSVQIPNSVISIGNNAFLVCEALNYVNLHDSISSIGIAAFYGCVKLSSVNIPNALSSLSDIVFKNTGLSSIIIPNSIISIGKGAFGNCNELVSANIPDFLVSIGQSAFSGCTSLSSTIILPNTLTKIESSVFDNCSSLTSIIIGDNILTIGSEAFYNCSSLESIIMPPFLDSVGSSAFSFCSSLASITFSSITPPAFEPLAFEYASNYLLINVPCGSKELYKELLNNRNVQDEISCNFSSVKVVNISDISATIIVNTAIPNITRTMFEYKANGDKVFNTYIDSLANLQYTINGLSSNTIYNYRVFYEINNELYYTPIDTFQTNCMATINLPFYEDFESELTCWTSFKTSKDSLNLVSSGSYPSCSPCNGSNMLMFNSYNIQAGNYAVYISPQMNIAPNSKLSFWIYRINGEYSSSNEGVRVLINSVRSKDKALELGFVSNNRLDEPVAYYDGWHNYMVSIPPSQTGERFMILKAESQYGYNIYIDDLIISSIPTIKTNIDASICNGETYALHGFNFNREGKSIQNLKTVEGGDSVVTLNLSVYPLYDTTCFIASVCQGEAYSLNGFNADLTGNYIQSLNTVNGCDSTVKLSLIVNPIKRTTILSSICQGETYSLNGFNADKSGTYIQNLQTTDGCDSIVQLTLEVTEIAKPIIMSLDSIEDYFELRWIGNGARYIVYRNDIEIEDLIGTIYKDTNLVEGVNYCYKVKSKKGDCESEFSKEVCQVFLGSSNQIQLDFSLSLLPNPCIDKTVLKIQGLEKDAEVVLYDINGRKVNQYSYKAGQESLTIDVNGLEKGVYSLRISNENTNINKKLIVQ